MNYREALEKLLADGYTSVKTNADLDDIVDHLHALDDDWNPEVVVQKGLDGGNEARIIEVLPDGYLSTGDPLAVVYKGKLVFDGRPCTYLRDWNGYSIYGDDYDQQLLIIEDQDGNLGRFDADDRDWEDLEDLLSLLNEDLTADRIVWN